MQSITLQRLLPAVFTEDKVCGSQIWLHDVEFRRGEYTLLEAASGAGKSSLCAYLYGSRNDYSGAIRFDGIDCRTLSTAQWGALHRRSLSLLFQELRLFEELTVRENIDLKNNLTGFKTAAQIDELLGQAGVAEKRDVPAGKLSLGQQQRVAFVRGLCQPFDFALLDEPVSHLDAANGAILSALLLNEARAQGAGVIVTSVGSRLDLPYNRILTL